MSTARTASTICGIILMLAGACEQLPDFRYQTEHLHVATDFDEPLCRGDLDHYELLISTLESQLGTTLDKQVDVYLWDPLAWSPSPGWCSSETASGCYGQATIHSSLDSVDHELVHAVAEGLGSPAPFWSEGAAEALQSDRTFFNNSLPLDNVDLDTSTLSYQTAGHFSRWLLETYGQERYRELLRSRGSARSAFAATYSMSLEDAQSLYVQEAPYSYDALVTCEHPELERLDPTRWAESIEVNCEAKHVRGGPRGMGAFRVLTVEQRATYALFTDASIATIARCRDLVLDTEPVADDPAYGDVPPTTPEFVTQYVQLFAVGGETTVLDLVPGRYEILVGFPDFEPGDVTVSVELVSP